MEAIQIAAGLLDLLEKLAPVIEDGVQKGTITPEQQLAVRQRAENLFAPGKIDAAFQGPEWQPSQPSGVTGFAVEPEHPKNSPQNPA